MLIFDRNFELFYRAKISLSVRPQSPSEESQIFHSGRLTQEPEVLSSIPGPIYTFVSVFIKVCLKVAYPRPLFHPHFMVHVRQSIGGNLTLDLFSSLKPYLGVTTMAVKCQISRICATMNEWNEPRHDKTNNVVVRPAQTQISLGIRQVWPDSSLSAQRVAKGLSYLHAESDASDQTGRMPRLIRVCAGRTTTLLVLSCRGSNRFQWFGFAWQLALSASLNKIWGHEWATPIIRLSMIKEH